MTATMQVRRSIDSRLMRRMIVLFLLMALPGGPWSHTLSQSSPFAQPPSLSQPSPSGEYLLKAAFLYNFAKFVEWPDAAFDGARGSFTLCILGVDPFGEMIETIEGKTIKGRNLKIKRLRNAAALDGCQILFISQSERDRLPNIRSLLKEKPTLTVCDLDGCAERGAMINLVKIDDRIGIEINAATTRRSPLKISSQLFKLAKIVTNNHQ